LIAWNAYAVLAASVLHIEADGDLYRSGPTHGVQSTIWGPAGLHERHIAALRAHPLTWETGRQGWEDTQTLPRRRRRSRGAGGFTPEHGARDGMELGGTYTDWAQTAKQMKARAPESPPKASYSTSEVNSIPATSAAAIQHPPCPATSGGMRAHSGILATPHPDRNDAVLSAGAWIEGRGASAPILAGLVERPDGHTIRPS
jgi:hypothetical protein